MDVDSGGLVGCIWIASTSVMGDGVWCYWEVPETGYGLELCLIPADEALLTALRITVPLHDNSFMIMNYLHSTLRFEQLEADDLNCDTSVGCGMAGIGTTHQDACGLWHTSRVVHKSRSILLLLAYKSQKHIRTSP